jgi:dsDNA-specific endonuclease/ATPase MutS2
MKLKVDLHDCYSDGKKIEAALRQHLDKAVAKKIKMVEIIPGKGSGQLKKSVLRFLEKNYKGIYHRIEKDDKNWGRIFVHFRWKK